MKRTWIVVLAVCAAVFFTACEKSKNIETNSNTTAGTTETTGASQSTASDQATQKAPGSEEEFKILTGKITSVGDTMESMTLSTGNNEITIDLKNVDVETSYALDTDVNVNVIYKGEISGSDLTNAKIVMVVDGQEGLKVQEVTGSVSEQAMSTFTIKTKDDTEYCFLKNNCEGLYSGVLGEAVNDNNGSGAMIKVTYVAVGYDADMTDFPLKVEAVK